VATKPPEPGRQGRRKAGRQWRTATGASAATAPKVTMRRACFGGAAERGTPHGEAGWPAPAARRPGLEHTLRPRARRRKEAKSRMSLIALRGLGWVMRSRRLLLLLAIGGLIAAATVGLGVFAEYGRAEKAARLSGLMNVWKYLLDYARANGKYPGNLWEAVPEDLFRSELEVAPLEYIAAGKPYPLQGDSRVFCDRAARRYGFKVGWFDFSEHDWSFHEGER